MKQKLLLFAFTLFSTMLFSQSQNMAFEEWKNNTGTQNLFYKITPVTDFKTGDTYVAGATVTMNGTTDILITKYYANGTFAWTQQYNGLANAIDFAAGIYVDNSQNVYVTGAVSNDTNNVTLTDLILIKYDNNGNQQWVATYDAGVGGLDIGKDIIVDDSNGNVYVTGGSHNSTFNSDILMICFDVSGTQQWVNRYNYNSLDDVGYKISMPRGPSELLVTGACTSSTNNYKLTNIAIDASNGSISSITTSTAVTTSSVDVVNDVVIDAQKNIYITGGYNVSGQGLNYYTMKMDSNLVIQWQQYYNGTSNLNDVAKGLDVDNSGNVYVTGYSTSSTQGRNFVTIKYNSAGSQQWAQTFNNTSNTDDEASDIVVDSLLNIYVTGSTISSLNQSDYYTIKYNSSGTKIWDIQTDAHHLNDKATNLVVDINNDIIITGQCETAPNSFEYNTVKYVQKDIQLPIDATSELTSSSYLFYENKGQIINSAGSVESAVTHATMDAYPAIFFKPKTFSYKLYNFDNLANVADTTQRIDISLNGGKETSKGYSYDKSQGIVNFFDAKIPTVVTEVQGFKKIIVPEVYSGIEAHYSSNRNGLKIYYIVKPGTDPRIIRWDINGANSTAINGVNLEIQGINKKIVYDRPNFYQTNLAGTTIYTLAAGTWTNIGTNSYGFNIPVYNNTLPLIIELDYGNTISPQTPPIGNLEFCTYYGGARDEGFRTIKSSPINGRYVVAGTTNSWALNRDFPILGAATSSVTTNYRYMTLVLFDSVGARVATNIYGGMTDIEPKDIILHNNTNKVTVIGNMASSTASLLPTNTSNLTPGTYTVNDGNGFAIQFENVASGSLTTIRWQTRLNGYASNIALSPDYQSMYITSSTNPLNYTPDLMSKSSAYNNSSGSGSWDFQISKFNSLGVRQWATYFPVGNNAAINTYSPTSWFRNYSEGTMVDDWMKCRIDCDNYGFVIAGEVKSTYLPYYNKYHKTMDSTFNGYTDAFVARFNKNDSLVFSQYIGGSSEDGFLGVKITKPNEISLVGYSNSSEYADITYRANSTEYVDTNMVASGIKMLITKIDSTGQKKWSTYYGNGGAAPCLGWAITNDSKGTIYMTGTTYGSFNIASTNPTGVMNETSQLDLTSGSSGTGRGDAFMLAFNSSNQLTWNTYFGGKYDDAGLALNYNSKKDRVLITGITSTPTWEPCCIAHKLFPICYPIAPFNPLSWIREDINSSSQLVGSLSYSNYDGYIGWWKTDKMIVGIEEYFNNKTNEMFTLFPNPTNQESYIAFKNRLEGAVTIEIYSVNGQLLYIDTIKSISDHTLISLPTYKFSAGVYIVSVKNNANFMTKKLIITK